MKIEDIDFNHNIVTIIVNSVSYTIYREKLGADYIVHTIELPLSELHKNHKEAWMNHPETREWMTTRIGLSKTDFEWYIIGSVLLHVLQVDSIEKIKDLSARTIYYKEADNLFVFIGKEEL